MVDDTIEKYRDLIRSFVDRKMDAATFELTFLGTFKKETTLLPPNVFEALDALFAAVDALCLDPKLYDEHVDLTEEQLRTKCSETLKQLQ
jgi:hypothetical protein